MEALRPPLEVQRPERVARLPNPKAGLLLQCKLDGHRVVAFVDEDAVILQARSGRIVTDRFPEVTPALASLEPGTVLDGEVVAVKSGRFDFHALAAAPRARAQVGVAISYVAFDLLADRGQDVRRLRQEERWTRLLARLHGAPAGLEPVMATLDVDEALGWMTALKPIGVEGIVARDLAAPYRAGLGHGAWKLRGTDTVDAHLVGVVGPAEKPTALRVQFEDGHQATTTNLSAARRRELIEALQAAADDPFLLEVHVSDLAGRHERVEFIRVRMD